MYLQQLFVRGNNMVLFFYFLLVESYFAFILYLLKYLFNPIALNYLEIF